MWEGTFALLARDRDNEYLMIDISIVRAHAQAATRPLARSGILHLPDPPQCAGVHQNPKLCVVLLGTL